MEKFTRGKWIVKCENDSLDLYVKDADNKAAICKLYIRNAVVSNKEEAVANANLIASAPELLEALKKLTSAVVSGQFNKDSRVGSKA